MGAGARTVVVLAAVHTIVVLVHAAIHAGLGVIPGVPDAVFILTVIIAGPLAGAAVLVWKSVVAGAWVFGGTVGAALVYGVLSHFVIAGPDHVASVGFEGWGALFLVTSLAIGAIEATGMLVAVALLAVRSRTLSGPAGRSP